MGIMTVHIEFQLIEIALYLFACIKLHQTIQRFLQIYISISWVVSVTSKKPHKAISAT